ncbi:MAG: tetratricopeptide repeat protein, partial [Betaproteobacteria bacterium]|nr:tetratricopeptide repeat protein [Betaproteobacteria bacterium]
MSTPKSPRIRQGTGSKPSVQKDDRLLSQGLEFHKAGEVDQAVGIYAEILSRNPKHPGALHLLGVLFYQSGSGARAVHLISQAVELEPDNPVFLMNLGNALQCDGQLVRAEESFRRALYLRPNFAEALNNLGTTLVGRYRIDEAINCFGEAIAINPSNPEPYNNRGNAYQALKRFDAALLDFQEALRLRPDYADAHSNLGYALVELNRLDEAIASFESATRIDHNFEYVRGALHHTKMRVCDWSNYATEVDSLLQDLIQRGAKCVPAFAILSISDSLSVQRRAAEVWTSDKHPSQDASCPIRERHSDDRIRIGYYSADFYQHATAYLIAEIFELHDKARFEVIAFHFGPLTGDRMQRRIQAAVDSFHDVSHQSDYDIAQLSRELGVDIAIDLKGFTQSQRAGIFANRAAPVQVNFLGYPGTMGAEYIDYIIADSELIPEESRPYYTEDIIYLTGSYQPNDRQRPISANVPT